MAKTNTADKKTTRVWITKYALTQGVFEVDAELVPVQGSPGEFYASDGRLFTREWAPTEAAARADFQRMKVAKINSLKRRLARLEALQFFKKE